MLMTSTKSVNCHSNLIKVQFFSIVNRPGFARAQPTHRFPSFLQKGQTNDCYLADSTEIAISIKNRPTENGLV